MKKKYCVLIIIIILIIFNSCAVMNGIFELLLFADSVGERIDDETKIQIFIDNKTNETLVVFVNDYKKGAELARISKGKEQRINITKGRKIYISGGNSGRDYREITCDIDSETYAIRQ